MATVTYLGSDDPSEDTVCTVFGLAFERGQPVELEDVPSKLWGHPLFQVDGERPGDTPSTQGTSEAEQDANAADPFDHDGDGHPGGQAPLATDGEKATLQQQLRDLGVKFHPNAGVAKLTALLEDATAPQPVPQDA